MIETLEARFWAKVDKGADCWNWIGGHNGKGYGLIFIEKKDGQKLFAYTHRLSWCIAFGSIPEGLHVCHHCDNPRCVKPDHLFVGTRKENMQDCSQKGRTGARLRGVTHCKHGHPFDEANTRYYGKSQRSCRACSRRAQAEYRKKRKAAV